MTTQNVMAVSEKPCKQPRSTSKSTTVSYDDHTRLYTASWYHYMWPSEGEIGTFKSFEEADKASKQYLQGDRDDR